MGSSAFAVSALTALAQTDGVKIPAVYTQPPRRAGRGQKLQKTEIHEISENLGLETRTPASLFGPSELSIMQELQPDLVLVASYGLLLPSPVLAVPHYGCVNIHASNLPRWRGASPIQQAILHGDPTTGVDFFQMEQGLDTGPILLRATVDIQTCDTGGTLHDRLAVLGGTMVPKFIKALQSNALVPAVQDERAVTYAPKIGKGDGTIDWSQPAIDIERQIRAFNPWPGAWTSHEGNRLRIWRAKVETGSGKAGEVIGEPLLIATGEGALGVESIQRAGRKPMSAWDLLRGYPMAPGVILGS